MSIQRDIVIVGGGIVGAACAAALARDGRQVVVLEQGPIGGGATAAGMGHIVVMDDSDAQLALTAYSRRLWHELVPQLPRGAECDACGTIWVAADAEDMAAVEAKHHKLARLGIRSQVLDAGELARVEPNLRTGLSGGLLVPDDFVLYPPCAAEYVLRQAREHSAEVRTCACVRSLGEDGLVTLEDGTTIRAGLVIIAAGCWSPSLTGMAPVRRRKGHLVITDRYPGFVRHQLIELGYLQSAHGVDGESVAFNIQPRKTGQLLIGSSRQFDAEGTEVDMSLVGKMLRRATRFLPQLGRLSVIRMWTGQRAATPDKLPLIGPSMGSDRVWLATGHEGLGITTALGTGQLIADLLDGRTPDIDAAPYLPERFAT